MANIKKSLTELVGNTPLLELTNYNQNHRLSGRILAKLEAFNPLGSAKDRAALSMVQAGIREGKIHAQTTLIEPTSGNTGVGLAFVAATMGLRLILTMPETMSVERRSLVKALGAEVVLTEGKLGMKGAIAKAEALAARLPDALILQQFENPANPEAHRQSTGPEILRDTDGQIDAFVAGVGTGGTITGVGELLKEVLPTVQIIAVEPADSPVLSEGRAGPHKLQGIGAGFVPKALNTAIYDEIITITTEEAFTAAKEVARMDGVLCGISSGAALAAATKVALRPAFEGKTIVTLFPDTGERYLSTGLYED